MQNTIKIPINGITRQPNARKGREQSPSHPLLLQRSSVIKFTKPEQIDESSDNKVTAYANQNRPTVP
ncbi:hypothetical protein O9992_07905 [Vibrio lentus]|nr:hypothetical protein [Vibrio lentus]